MKGARIFWVFGLGLIIWGLGCGGGGGGGGGGTSSPLSQVSSLEGDWLCTTNWVDCHNVATPCTFDGDTVRVTISFSEEKPYVAFQGGAAYEYDYVLFIDELEINHQEDDDARELVTFVPINDNSMIVYDVGYSINPQNADLDWGFSWIYNGQRIGGSPAGEGLKILNGDWGGSLASSECFPQCYDSGPNSFQASINYTGDIPIMIYGNDVIQLKVGITEFIKEGDDRDLIVITPIDQDNSEMYGVDMDLSGSDIYEAQSIKASCVRK